MKTTEEWLGFLLKESERYDSIISSLPLNDVSGLGGAMRRIIRRERDERPDGVLLTGPSGVGKHNAAWHILQALEEENFIPVFLSGEDLAVFKGDYPALAERLNALLDRFYDEGHDLCLILEEPERSGLGKQIYSFLGMAVRTYRSYPAGDPSLFLILIAKKQPPLPSLLRDRLLYCPCELPDREKRAAYLAERGKMIRRFVSMERLAELSEGCSYAALGQIVDMLDFSIEATDRTPDEETMLRCIRQVTVQEQPKGKDPVAEVLQRLETVFSGLKDTLSGIGPGRQASETESAWEQESPPQKTADAETKTEMDRQEVEDMPISALSTDLFTEDMLHALLEN